MPIESATFISQLNPAWPLGSEPKSVLDDHARLTKAVLQAQFPNFGAGAVNATHTALNQLTAAVTADASGNVHVPGGGAIATNEAIGTGALKVNTTGYQNTAVGVNALTANTTGYNNTASGAGALSANTTGYHNTASGFGALSGNVAGSSNTASGFAALQTNTTGSENTASGVNALQANTTGIQNIAAGVNALAANTSGSQNTAVGVNALVANTAGSSGTAVGVNALSGNTTGIQNSALGGNALQSNTSGYLNTATGLNALQFNTSGYHNTATGVNALAANTTGNTNTAIGVNALQANTGNSNSVVGVNALSANVSFSNCSGLGYGSQVSGSNQVQLGDATTTTYVYGTVQNRSDLRDKADVRDTVLGLAFIDSLRPVDYRWDMRSDYAPAMPQRPETDDADVLALYELSKAAWLDEVKPENLVHDGSKKRSRYHHGFIAQEVIA